MKFDALFDPTEEAAIAAGGTNGISKATTMLCFASPIPEWAGGQTVFVNGGGEETVEQG